MKHLNYSSLNQLDLEDDLDDEQQQQQYQVNIEIEEVITTDGCRGHHYNHNYPIKIEETDFEFTINDDNEDHEDVSDLISLPSITQTNNDDLTKLSNCPYHSEPTYFNYPNSSSIQAMTNRVNDALISHYNMIDGQSSTNAIIQAYSADGGGLSRSDTMTDTFVDGEDIDTICNKNRNEVDDDGELDEEIVQRNLNFCRGTYADEFKLKQRCAVGASKSSNRMVKTEIDVPPRPVSQQQRHQSNYPCYPYQTRQPRLLMREEHIEETTKTCKK